MKKEFKEVRKLLRKYEGILEIVLNDYGVYLHRYSNKRTPACERDVKSDLVYLKQVLKLN